jgi:hypothetical protein
MVAIHVSPRVTFSFMTDPFKVGFGPNDGILPLRLLHRKHDLPTAPTTMGVRQGFPHLWQRVSSLDGRSQLAGLHQWDEFGEHLYDLRPLGGPAGAGLVH